MHTHKSNTRKSMIIITTTENSTGFVQNVSVPNLNIFNAYFGDISR